MTAKRKPYDDDDLALDIERGDMTREAIAARHGICAQHLSRMVHGHVRPEFARRLARARAELQGDIRRRLRGLQDAAVDTLRRAMREDEDEPADLDTDDAKDGKVKPKPKRKRRAPVGATALAAAKEVLNRSLPEEAQEQDRPTLVDLLPGFAKLTPETLALVDKELGTPMA